MFKKKKFYYKENKRSGIEIKVSKYLKDNDIKFLYNARFSDCKNPYTGQELMFDFWLYEKNIIIETDGPQHSKYVKEFDGKDKTKYLKRMAKDTIKDEYCKVKKINLIRIPYEDFDNFEKIINEKVKIGRAHV